MAFQNFDRIPPYFILRSQIILPKFELVQPSFSFYKLQYFKTNKENWNYVRILKGHVQHIFFVPSYLSDEFYILFLTNVTRFYLPHNNEHLREKCNTFFT